MTALRLQSADPILVVNRQFVCTEANSALSHLCKKPIEDILGRPAAELLGNHAFHSAFRPQLERAFSGEIAYCHAWLPCRDKPRYVRAHCFPGCGAERPRAGHSDDVSAAGEVDQVVVAMKDHTEAKRADDAARRKYHLLVAHARDIVLFIREDDGQVVEANHAAVRAYGYPLGEMLALTIHDLSAPVVQQVSRDPAAKASVPGVPFETLHRRRTGDLFPVEVSVVRADVGGDRLLLYVVRDISEQRTAQRYRQDFVQLAAHDMKTPLATLRGYVQMLLRTGGHDDAERRALGALERQTKRLARLAQSLLEVSRIQSGDWSVSLSPAHLHGLVREAIDTFKGAQPISIRLASDGAASAVVEVDRARILEVVDNLLDNAAKYGAGVGPIEVAIGGSGGEAVVSVHDDGPGIPIEVQERLFEPWYQTAPMVRPTAGMGLGLYISREIIRLHGGRIWVESEAGRGSTFFFTLPISHGGC